MSQATLSHWSYLFSDSSRLVGQVYGELSRETNQLIRPTQMSAKYLDRDGETILGSWKEKDFVCFDLSKDGSEIAIVASNDGFVANSMCLVFCSTRSRAQVTDWGSQLIAEPFKPSAWSMTPEIPSVRNDNRLHPSYARLPSSPSPFSQKREKGSRNQSPSPALGEGFRVRAAQVGCTHDNRLLLPLFPSVSFTWRLPHSRTTYQWTFSPFLPFSPFLHIEQMAAKK